MMLIAFSPPAAAVTLDNGTWLTADGGAACVDRKPLRCARYQSGSAVQVGLTFGAAQSIRVVGALGLKGLAEGQPLTLQAGGSYANSVRRFWDGSLGAWWVLPAGVSLASLAITLPAGTVDIGEIFAAPALEIEHAPDWNTEIIDPSEASRSQGGAVATTRKRAYRRLQVGLTVQGAAAVRGGGLADGMDWMQLAARLAGDAPCAAVVRWHDASGAESLAEANATAVFGRGKLSAIPHQGGDYYSGALWLEEVPAAM